MENRWAEAIRKRDVAALDELLARDFEGSSENGRTASKARMLALLRADKNVYSSVRAQRMSVRSAGPNTAIVNGTSTETGVTADGRKFKVSRNFIDTWEERNGRWQCVSSRVTTVR